MSPDIISKLPQDIIQAILCLLPTKQALRTSILSRDWRYKWTKIPKLVFSSMHEVLESNFLHSVRQVLLLHNGPIHEFSLTMDDDFYTGSDVDQILLFLLKNHVLTSLALEFLFSSYDLPLFVCNGFGSLTNLSLEGVRMRSETLLQVLSNCPSLKNFSLFMFEQDFLGHKRPTMVELFKCLPVIERLTILSHTAQIFVPDLIMQELPTTLIHLKYICVEHLHLFDGNELTFLAVLFKCLPNLEKIEIEVEPCISWDDTETNILEEYYSDVRLEHLTELMYDYYTNLRMESELLKFIMARSSKLKRVSIRCMVLRAKESEVLHTLLQIPRASPVEIDVSFF